MNWDPTTWWSAGAVAATGLGAAGALGWRSMRERGFDQWLPAALWTSEPRPPIRWEDGAVHVFIAICDHYEPEFGNADPHTALARVRDWQAAYPRLFAEFRDVDGRPPQHTFFFPQDQYRPEYLGGVAELVHAGWGDADIHLHHDNDTPAGLREKLESFRDTLCHQHGLLRRDPLTGDVVYGFIHGNWALNNCRRDGRWCGVDHEIPILRQTGCYADFTLPSAPSDTQTRTINSIYYAQDIPGRRKSHDRGRRARVGQATPPDSLLMIQGPLGFDWSRRKFGLLPRVENGDLLGNHPPTAARLPLWLNAGVIVAGQPHWRFIKLHTHGCKPANQRMLLSETMQQFHRVLAQQHQREPNFRYHYVTAWQMAQLVHAAEEGHSDPAVVLNPGNSASLVLTGTSS